MAILHQRPYTADAHFQKNVCFRLSLPIFIEKLCAKMNKSKTIFLFTNLCSSCVQSKNIYIQLFEEKKNFFFLRVTIMSEDLVSSHEIEFCFINTASIYILQYVKPILSFRGSNVSFIRLYITMLCRVSTELWLNNNENCT